MMNLREYVTDQQAKALREKVDDLFKEEWIKYQAPDYYRRRKYGKWTIYNKDGMRVAWGLNERESKAYMKLLEEK